MRTFTHTTSEEHTTIFLATTLHTTQLSKKPFCIGYKYYLFIYKTFRLTAAKPQEHNEKTCYTAEWSKPSIQWWKSFTFYLGQRLNNFYRSINVYSLCQLIGCSNSQSWTFHRFSSRLHEVLRQWVKYCVTDAGVFLA